MIKPCPPHNPHASSWGRTGCLQRKAYDHGDSPPATPAKSTEMGLKLFSGAWLCRPWFRPCLLPCLHSPSLQTVTPRHRLQSGRQLTLDRWGYSSFLMEDGKKPQFPAPASSKCSQHQHETEGKYQITQSRWGQINTGQSLQTSLSEVFRNISARRGRRRGRASKGLFISVASDRVSPTNRASSGLYHQPCYKSLLCLMSWCRMKDSEDEENSISFWI